LFEFSFWCGRCPRLQGLALAPGVLCRLVHFGLAESSARLVFLAANSFPGFCCYSPAQCVPGLQIWAPAFVRRPRESSLRWVRRSPHAGVARLSLHAFFARGILFGGQQSSVCYPSWPVACSRSRSRPRFSSSVLIFGLSCRFHRARPRFTFPLRTRSSPPVLFFPCVSAVAVFMLPQICAFLSVFGAGRVWKFSASVGHSAGKSNCLQGLVFRSSAGQCSHWPPFPVSPAYRSVLFLSH
jgi:hypothetical protein